MALPELVRIAPTLFILFWLHSVDCRRRVHAGLASIKAKLATPCQGHLPHRLGKMMDGSFEQQRSRASGLTLVTAAIALWNKSPARLMCS